MKKEVVAMLLAGGQGSRLYALTSHVAKPAVPFGGKYRIIDFPLSNCVNSGIDTVGVLTQYRPLELNSYLGNGQPWDLDRADGGVHILPPYMREGDQGTWYKGTANAIYQNIGFVDLYDPEYVAVLNVDEHDRIYEFEEKPAHPKSNLASMGIYVFTWSKLRQYLIDDEADPGSSNDFGKNIIPNMLAAGELLTAYRFHGYWKDVGTIDSLWDANMDMLAPHNSIDLHDPEWPIYARSPIKPPHATGPHAKISHSLVTGGGQIDGTVENSVLFHSVVVEEGARVQYSILMPGAVVKAGADVSYAIVAENAVIEANAQVGSAPDDSPDWGIAVVAGGVTIGAGATVAPRAMIREDVKGGEQA